MEKELGEGRQRRFIRRRTGRTLFSVGRGLPDRGKYQKKKARRLGTGEQRAREKRSPPRLWGIGITRRPNVQNARVCQVTAELWALGTPKAASGGYPKKGRSKHDRKRDG